MRVLITGGSGFIGSSLTEYLTLLGIDVNILDLQTPIKRNPCAHYYQGDINNHVMLKKAMSNCDMVIHLAAKISVTESFEKSAEYIETNVLGTNHVLSLCQELQIPVIYASSSAVYGEGRYFFPELNEFHYPIKRIHLDNFEINGLCLAGIKMPSHEADHLYPQSVYALTKTCNEDNSMWIHPGECCGLRFGNVYGPGQTNHYAGFITLLIRSVKHNEVLNIYEDGLQTRNFIHIDNVVEAIYKVMLGFRQGIYNVGFPNSRSVLEIVTSCQHELAKIHQNLEYKILGVHRKGDIRHSALNTDKFEKDFGSLKYISIEEEIIHNLSSYI